MTHGHPTRSPHQHGPRSGADTHADCGHDHRGGVHVHNHAPKDFGFAFALGTALNIGFVVLEPTAGVFANSMALLADAGHNLSDVLCLLMAWGASLSSSGGQRCSSRTVLARPRSLRRLPTGFCFSLPSAQFPGKPSSACRPRACRGRDDDSRRRARHLDQRFHRLALCLGGERDVNIRGAYLHMADAAAISFGVVIAGIFDADDRLELVDPVVSLILVAAIVWATWGLLRDATRLALHGVPAGIDPSRCRADWRGCPASPVFTICISGR